MVKYRYTYFLTPCSRILLEKLNGLQLVKKFPAFYGTRRFITAFTSSRHLFLSWASSIQSTRPHPTSWRSILILSSHLHSKIQLFISLFISKLKQLEQSSCFLLLNITLASLTRCIMSSLFFPSSVNTLPRYWNFGTCLGRRHPL
jgi:hypothetical protein